MKEIDSLIGLATNNTVPGLLQKAVNEGESAAVDTLQDSSSRSSLSAASSSLNPILGMENMPLPLSFLNCFAESSKRIPEFDDVLYESFGDSALVAIGMFVEEMITASLLPLAGLHVLRCRELEKQKSLQDEEDEWGQYRRDHAGPITILHPITCQEITYDPRNIDKEEDPFVAWTLPPEEAMIKLLLQGVIPSTGVPLLRDPTLSTVSSDDPQDFDGLPAAYGRMFPADDAG